MSATNSDRNLLLGLLALQNGFVSREQLVAGFSTWLLDKRQALGAILRDQGALDRDTQELLSALTSRHLAMHGDDAQRSLAAVSSVASARDDLQHLADAELNASLGHVPLWQRADDPFATRIVSVGAASAAGQRFRILRPHAKGGLGLVSVALDGELNREVALKEIQAQLADDAESRARFLREAELTGGLEHPGIVPVYGMGTYDDGRPFYAMRFIRGDSLKAALEVFHHTDWSQRREGERALHLRNLLGRFVDVCNAVAYAHSRGVLHRDLKPGNIMLGHYGETLVVDWGLAKAQYQLHASDAAETPLRPSGSDLNQTLPGKAVGTPGYMSPEQAAGRMHDLGPKTDVYSLGATLYHVLTGRSAISGLDVGEVLQRIQRGDFLPARRLDATIPRPLDAICLKAMALSAADRYVSPKELADDVECWLADEPVSAYAEPLAGRISRVARRHKGVVRASAIALTAVAVIATLAAIRENSLNTALTETIAQRDEALKAAATATGEALSSVAFLQDLFTTTDPLGMDAVDLDGRYYLSGSNLTPLQLVNEGDQRLKSLQLSPQSRAVLLETIGNAFRGLGQYERADPLLTESLQLRMQFLPADSLDLALCRFNLANLRQDQGRFGEAEALYRTAITVLETQPADLKTLANMQFSLAWTLSQRYGAGRDERFAEAIAIMQRVVETRTQIYTRRSKEVAMTLATLSLICRVAGRGAEEIAALGQATEIMKELGGDVVATIFVDYTTAQALRKLQVRDQSLAYYERAYDATVNLAGKEHPAAIFLLADLAGFYNEMGENETALRLATEAVDILDRSPLRWSPLAVDGMLDYARWLQESGDTLRVREVLQQALLIAHTIEHAPLIEKCNQRINELPEALRM